MDCGFVKCIRKMKSWTHWNCAKVNTESPGTVGFFDVKGTRLNNQKPAFFFPNSKKFVKMHASG